MLLRCKTRKMKRSPFQNGANECFCFVKRDFFAGVFCLKTACEHFLSLIYFNQNMIF